MENAKNKQMKIAISDATQRNAMRRDAYTIDRHVWNGGSGNGTTSTPTSTVCKTNNPTNELKCRVHVEQITIPIPSTLSIYLSLSQVAGDDVEVGGKSLN